DVAKLRDMQRALRQARTPDRKGSNLGVSIDACRRGPLPEGALLSSTYLQLAHTDGYMPLLEDMDLRAEIGEEALAMQIPPCGEASAGASVGK
ncbi:MAG: hypothetical protein ABL907_05975, partial [Hyphomicrobium sp.]